MSQIKCWRRFITLLILSWTCASARPVKKKREDGEKKGREVGKWVSHALCNSAQGRGKRELFREENKSSREGTVIRKQYAPREDSPIAASDSCNWWISWWRNAMYWSKFRALSWYCGCVRFSSDSNLASISLREWCIGCSCWINCVHCWVVTWIRLVLHSWKRMTKADLCKEKVINQLENTHVHDLQRILLCGPDRCWQMQRPPRMPRCWACVSALLSCPTH